MDCKLQFVGMFTTQGVTVYYRFLCYHFSQERFDFRQILCATASDSGTQPSADAISAHQQRKLICADIGTESTESQKRNEMHIHR